MARVRLRAGYSSGIVGPTLHSFVRFKCKDADMRISSFDRLKRPASILLCTVLAAGILLSSMPASADEPGESTVASELVRQAIALIVNTPDNVDAAREKVGDALEVDNRKGVDIALVRDADDALADDDLHLARSLLEESIGARPHLGTDDVAAIGEVSPEAPTVGADPGEAVILDPLDTSDVDGGDAVAISAGVILALIGLLLAWRWRPARLKEAQ